MRVMSMSMMRPGAEGHVADLGVAHLAGREADRLARGLDLRHRVVAAQAREEGRVRAGGGVAGPPSPRPKPSSTTSDHRAALTARAASRTAPPVPASKRESGASAHSRSRS